MAGLAELEWIQQRSKIHIAREKDEDERFIPWCREDPFPQDPQLQGVGLSCAVKERYCLKRLRRMPGPLSHGLCEEFGWLLS